jgi:hypothetical protein
MMKKMYNFLPKSLVPCGYNATFQSNPPNVKYELSNFCAPLLVPEVEPEFVAA